MIAINSNLGAFTAVASSLTQILTPTAGWQSVNNVADATPGAPVEPDGALRQRQTISTSLPAKTPLEGIVASVANLTGVIEVASYENATGATDQNGILPHSIALVVNGGDVAAICNAIALKKPPGIPTMGTASLVIVDSNGVPNKISFYIMQTTQVYISITVEALVGYSSLIGSNIVKAVTAYIDSLSIGQKVYYNRLLAPANLTGDIAVSATGLTQAQLDTQSATYNITSMFIGTSPSPTQMADILIAFTAAAVADGNVALVAQ